MTTTDEGFAVDDRGEPRRRRGQRPAPRPLDALESQVALIDALRSPVGMNLVAGMTEYGKVDELSRRAANDLASTLNVTTTVVVTDRMLDFVLDRTASVPFGDPMVPDDLFFESAYFVFPRPVRVGPLADDDTQNFPRRLVAEFDSGFYVPQNISTIDELRHTEVPRDGIMYVQSISPPVMDKYLDGLRQELADGDPTDKRLALAEVEEGLRQIRALGLKHCPVYSSGWALGMSWDPELREPDFVLTPAGEFERRFWLALLRTVREEIFAPVRFKRADYRRAARRGLIPDVVVADLRRVKHRDKEETLPTGETIMWSHRWMRRGHPRTIHKGTDREKTVWVREHVCGPDSMPLILKDRVYRLSK